MHLYREQLARTRVLVVGDAMLDRYWHGSVERISPEAPVPVLKITREEERLGGASNVGCNVVSLGAQASFLSVVGDDEPGKRLEALLCKAGIAAHLTRDPRLSTTVKLRAIGRQQQLLRMDFESEPCQNVLGIQTAAFADLALTHQLVIFSDYGKGGLAQVSSMINRARSAGKQVLVDPKGPEYGRYKGATVVKPNRSELQEVIGRWHTEDELRSKVQALRERFEFGAVLLTRGEEGMTLFDAEGEFHVKAVGAEVFDVTGAGDTVIATLATTLAAGCSLRDAVAIANRAGGIVVGKFGTSTVSYEELFA